MKKLIVGLIVIGAILALRTAAGRIGQKMREHCREMAGNCRQMMAGKAGKSGQESGMREHCKEMAEQFGPGKTAEMQEHSEHEAPRLAGHEEAVSTA